MKATGTDISNPEAFNKFFGSTLDFIEIVAELLRPQWEQKQLTYEEFAELLIEEDGRIGEVQEAFKAGLSDFFHRLGDRAAAKVVEKAWNAASKSQAARLARAESQKLDNMIQQALDHEEKEFHRNIDEAAARIFGEPSTNVQA